MKDKPTNSDSIADFLKTLNQKYGARIVSVNQLFSTNPGLLKTFSNDEKRFLINAFAQNYVDLLIEDKKFENKLENYYNDNKPNIDRNAEAIAVAIGNVLNTPESEPILTQLGIPNKEKELGINFKELFSDKQAAQRFIVESLQDWSKATLLKKVLAGYRQNKLFDKGLIDEYESFENSLGQSNTAEAQLTRFTKNVLKASLKNLDSADNQLLQEAVQQKLTDANLFNDSEIRLITNRIGNSNSADDIQHSEKLEANQKKNKSSAKKRVKLSDDVEIADISSIPRDDKQESYILKKDTYKIHGGLRKDASEIEAGIKEAKQNGLQPEFEKRLRAQNKDPYYQRTQEAKEAYYDRMKQKPELNYKTDMEVFQGVVGKDMKDKQAHKVITIVSAKEDKSNQINLTFRAKDPKENFVVRGLKNLFNMDKVKVSIDKQEFNDKFHNSKFQNKDLKEIYKDAPPQKRNFITSELGARTAEEMRQISPDGKEFDPNQFSLVAHATIKNAATLKNIKANPVSKLANKIKRAPQTVKKFLRGEKDKGGRSL
jgi:hypothetical protein